MRVVIAGGHGQIALRLERLLADRGDTGVALIRNPAQSADVAAAGGEPVVLDLERASADELAKALEGADAVVFAAGAGPGSSAERKDTVDRAGSVLLADAAERAGVRRFLQVSSAGAGQDPVGDDPVWAAYIRAKTAAEEDLRARRGLDATILRPGSLTNGPGTGRVTLVRPPGARGAVPRDDVAAVLAALLVAPGTADLTLELIGGEVPVADAVAVLSAQR